MGALRSAPSLAHTHSHQGFALAANEALLSAEQYITPSESTWGLTELILSSSETQQTQLLLPMLAQLTRLCGDQWITFVALDGFCEQLLNAEELKTLGAEHHKIRIVRANTPADARWIIWEALKLGNSHTVIASPGKLSAVEFSQLEFAAQAGNSQGLLLRSR